MLERSDVERLLKAIERNNSILPIVCLALLLIVVYQTALVFQHPPPLTLAERKALNARIERLELDLDRSKEGRLKDLEIMRDLAGYLKRLSITPELVNPKLKGVKLK